VVEKYKDSRFLSLKHLLFVVFLMIILSQIEVEEWYERKMKINGMSKWWFHVDREEE
jgi:hypothetical protein